MESRYKERAKELFLQYSLGTSSNPDHRRLDHTLIDLMCQLAEEVEEKEQIKYGKFCLKLYSSEQVFTKKQVEELLQKQRELCAEVAEASEYWGDSVVEPMLVVNKHVIRDTKLKID